MAFSFVCSFFTKNTVKKEKESPQATNKEPFYKYMFDKRVLLPCILVAFNYMAIAGTVNFMGAFGKEINVGGRISQFFIAQGIAMVIVRLSLVKFSIDSVTESLLFQALFQGLEV